MSGCEAKISVSRMSNRAAGFVEEWVSENAVKPVEGAVARDNHLLRRGRNGSLSWRSRSMSCAADGFGAGRALCDNDHIRTFAKLTASIGG